MLYNVFSGHGADLYGVEPVSYYVKNVLLNWNVCVPLALFALPSVLLAYFFHSGPPAGWRPKAHYRLLPALLIYAAAALWLLVFFSTAHKEERFLFPIYPLIALLAALCVGAWVRSWPGSYALANLLLVAFVVLSVSRGYALHRNFSASTETFRHFHDHFYVNQKSLDLSRFQVGTVRLLPCSCCTTFPIVRKFLTLKMRP